MRAMGIDPGTAICGFGVIDADGSRLKPVTYGTIQTTPDHTDDQVIDMTMRLLGIRQKIKPDDAADGLAMAIYAIYSSHSMSLKRKVQL